MTAVQAFLTFGTEQVLLVFLALQSPADFTKHARPAHKFVSNNDLFVCFNGQL